MTNIFTGVYELTIDTKKRITMPSKIRDCALRRKETGGVDIWYYSKHRGELYTITDSKQIIKDNPQDWFEVKPDKQNRIALHNYTGKLQTKFRLIAKSDYLILEKTKE